LRIGPEQAACARRYNLSVAANQSTTAAAGRKRDCSRAK
jgi:hypothetical protein